MPFPHTHTHVLPHQPPDPPLSCLAPERMHMPTHTAGGCAGLLTLGVSGPKVAHLWEIQGQGSPSYEDFRVAGRPPMKAAPGCACTTRPRTRRKRSPVRLPLPACRCTPARQDRRDLKGLRVLAGVRRGVRQQALGRAAGSKGVEGIEGIGKACGRWWESSCMRLPCKKLPRAWTMHAPQTWSPHERTTQPVRPLAQRSSPSAKRGP
eukprot:363585-Chlamydomonas_euryale.AAC.6